MEPWGGNSHIWGSELRSGRRTNNRNDPGDHSGGCDPHPDRSDPNFQKGLKFVNRHQTM